jgi:hypothetical protein
MDDDSILEPFEQLLTVLRHSPVKPLRFAGFLLLVALDQARFIARSSRYRNESRADGEDHETAVFLKSAAAEFDGKGEN